MKYDHVVIGGGVSGMTTALILAKHGCRVALIEKSRKLAPTIRGFTRGGLFFDTGFHYAGGLGTGGALDIFFRYLGLSGDIETYPFKEDGFDSLRCLDPAFEFHYPYGYDRLKERFHGAFPDDKKAIDEYFRTVKEIYSSLPYVGLDAKTEPAALGAVHGPSLQEFLDGLTDNGLLKCVLSMHCFLYGVSPGETPFAHHACIAGSYYESASGIKDGGQSLAKAFEARLEKTGVSVYMRTGGEKDPYCRQRYCFRDHPRGWLHLELRRLCFHNSPASAAGNSPCFTLSPGLCKSPERPGRHVLGLHFIRDMQRTREGPSGVQPLHVPPA